MKTLILILLSAACHGQYSDSDTTNSSTDYLFFETVLNDFAATVNQPSKNEIWNLTLAEEKLVTINMLLNYSIECYNDSTEQIEIGRYGRGRYYTHRTPTLEGFIEWLKKNQ